MKLSVDVGCHYKKKKKWAHLMFCVDKSCAISDKHIWFQSQLTQQWSQILSCTILCLLQYCFIFWMLILLKYQCICSMGGGGGVNVGLSDLSPAKGVFWSTLKIIPYGAFLIGNSRRCGNSFKWRWPPGIGVFAKIKNSLMKLKYIPFRFLEIPKSLNDCIRHVTILHCGF